MTSISSRRMKIVAAAYMKKAASGKSEVGDPWFVLLDSKDPEPVCADSQPHCQQLLSDSSIGWLQFGHLKVAGLLIEISFIYGRKI